MTATDQVAPADAHQHALALAAVGLRVLPIKPGGKSPPMNSWQHAATNDVAKIDNWYKGLYRTAGVGIAMGDQPGGWHLFALDLDRHTPGEDGVDTLYDLEADHGPLPETWRSITGSGGEHLIFAAPAGVTVRNQQTAGRRVGPGIDVRGEGGQIVVAPTIHPGTGQMYCWEHGYEPWSIPVAVAPAWLVELVREPDAPVITQTNNPTSAPQDGTVFDLQRADWDWHTELLRRGWTTARQHGQDTYWVRPGKNPRDGHSAVLHGNAGPFVVFTTEIDPAWTQAGTRTRDGSGWSFGPFGFYAAVEHAGDRSRAARALYEAYGVDPAQIPDIVPDNSQVDGSASTDDDDEGEDDWVRRPVVELARRMLAGDHQRTTPEHTAVEGALPLFYPGRIHSIFGPPGGGKTWVGLYALVERLKAGEHVAMFDWEDEEQGTTQRLIQLGCTLDDLERFDYRNPTSSLKWGWPLLNDDDTPWTMVVIDSAGEALAAQGVELNDDTGTAQWFGLLKKLAKRPTRPTVVMLDHIPKTSGDEPAKYAIGSQRKLAAITGASYRCDTLVEPARGKDGKLKLVVAKDRLGNRPKGSTACEIHLHDEGDQLVIRLAISEAQAAHERGEKFRPTHLMERVSRWLEINPGATRRQISNDVTGRAEAVRTAIDVLVEEGWIAVEKVGQSHQHRVVRDYRESSDTASTPVDNAVTGQVCPGVSNRVPGVSGTRSSSPDGGVSTVSPSVYRTGTRDTPPGDDGPPSVSLDTETPQPSPDWDPITNPEGLF